MSNDEERISDQLVEALLGGDMVRDLEERGLRPTLQIVAIGDTPAAGEAERLIDELHARRARHDRLVSLGELSSGVVHEVRNRVGAIRALTDVARRKQASPEVVALLERILQLTERCSTSLASVLSFASGATEPCATFDVSAAIERAAILTRHQLSGHDVSLEVSSGDGLKATGRASELVQIVVNLVLNAQQAMSGGGRVSIDVRRGPDGSVAIDVADDGPGVPAELRERVFEPFFTTKSSEVGTGLGLAICSRIAHSWGGSIEVGDSAMGGALFTVLLPA